MQPGVRPKPTAIKIVTGNPGKRELNRAEPRPRLEKVDPPPELDKEGRIEWDRVSVELGRMGLLTGVDRAALTGYCDAWSRWVQARRLIRQEAEENPKYEGLIVTGAHGGWVQNPAVGIANKAMADVIRYASEFGMTPSARSRIAATPRAAEEDPAAEFIN